jgi:carboxymethylenebutenolidase
LVKQSRVFHNHNRKRHYNLGAVFDKHIKSEFEDDDVDETMKTMVKGPYVHHVPVLTGGNGNNGVRDFYTNQQAIVLNDVITKSL